MAAPPSTEHILTVPQPLAGRLDQMVQRGEFATFAHAAIAMIQLGVAQHDGRMMPPAAGPMPPVPPRKDIPTPGPPGQGPPLGARAGVWEDEAEGIGE